MGLIGGRIVGLLGGSLISLPAFGNHEWLSSPMAALVGLLAGVIRQCDARKGRHLGFRTFLFSEYSALALESDPRRKRQLGHAAAVRLRRCSKSA